jgi:septum formation protein
MTADKRESPGFIYLASASPRRAELLTQLGLEFEVVPADLDESLLEGEACAEYVQRLSLEKARTVWANLASDRATVLAADTVVVLDDRAMGKPINQEDGLRMLSELSGRSHEVFTAVSVSNEAREATVLSRSIIRFRAISRAESVAYWQGGEPVDKAGGYAIQGKGAIFVEELHGSYSGVMGLPLFETARLLNNFGYRFF